MRYATLHKCFLWLLALSLGAGCVKQSPQENEPVQTGEQSVVLKLSGGVRSFDSPTKASDGFTPSSANLIYLYLVNNDGSYSIMGKGAYREDIGSWIFGYDGSAIALTTGEAYGYLFEKEWSRNGSGADEYIQLGPKVPVYQATSGSFSFTKVCYLLL